MYCLHVEVVRVWSKGSAASLALNTAHCTGVSSCTHNYGQIRGCTLLPEEWNSLSWPGAPESPLPWRQPGPLCLARPGADRSGKFVEAEHEPGNSCQSKDPHTALCAPCLSPGHWAQLKINPAQTRDVQELFLSPCCRWETGCWLGLPPLGASQPDRPGPEARDREGALNSSASHSQTLLSTVQVQPTGGDAAATVTTSQKAGQAHQTATKMPGLVTRAVANSPTVCVCKTQYC